MNSPRPWRHGRKVFRTIYDARERLIGMMDTPEDAAEVIAAVNGRMGVDDTGRALIAAMAAKLRTLPDDEEAGELVRRAAEFL